jgi:hypothetical protein
MTRVRGYCPMGCGETLFLGDGGHVTCSLIGCPRQGAVDELLSERDAGHVVRIGEETFDVQHPLRERLEGGLFACELHAWLSSLGGPPVPPGRYDAAPAPNGRSWRLRPLPDPQPPTQEAGP